MELATLQLLSELECGDLKWMCCLSYPDMVRLLNLYDKMGRTGFLKLYYTVCVCTPGKPPPKVDPPIVVPPIIVPPPPPVKCELPPKRAPK